MTEQPPSDGEFPPAPAPPWAPAPPPLTDTIAPLPPIVPPEIRAEPLNPWLSLWTRPRATMRQILDTNPRRLVIVLAILGGIAELLGTHLPLPGSLSPLFILAVKCVFGAIGGLLGLYVATFLGWMTGRWLGGQGNFVEVRAASAWPNVLSLWGALLWLPLAAYLGWEAVNFDPETVFEDTTGALLFVPVMAIGIVIVFWRIVTYIKCLAEAHRFSAWHALGAVLISCVLLLVPIAVLAGIVLGLVGTSVLSGS